MRTAVWTLLVLGIFPMTGRSDEGMWLFSDPPRELLRSKYGFDLTDAWVRRSMHASVRFSNGGSGGFVSKNGLIVTNHHIGADSLQKLTTAERDLLKDGYLAKSRADELKCPDLELNVLQSIEDVTARVESAVKPRLSPAEAAAARKAILSAIEKESLEATGLRSDVVTLYQGGLYHLYRYKKYTDVRLVFAPESGIAAFGGDVDNFEYPRFGYDFCFFRAYEKDQPAVIEHYFAWAKEGPKDGDLVFVTGHPGTTNRLETVDHLLYRRDHGHPFALARLRAMEAALLQFSERGPDERRVAATDLHRAANARKALTGQYQGLLDANILRQKEEKEESLRREAGPDANAWMRITAARRVMAQLDNLYAFLERGDAFQSELFNIARHLVRLPVELKKPSGERLREYRDSNLDSLKFQLFSPAPIDANVERAKLAAALQFFAERMGGGHTQVQRALDGKSPAARAAELVAGCKLFDPAVRKRLFDGGSDAVLSSDDPLIRLVERIDADARAVRKRFETEVEEPERQAYGQISRLIFRTQGKSIAPDATFTLRLAFGQVRGYEVDGKSLPFQTTVAGLYEKAERMGNREPFALPPRWRDAKSRVDMTTPVDFVSTADTIGGNSGSPVLNRAGELIGINFDRNRHGLVRNFVYTDVQARHIAVHGRGVLAVLKSVYNAENLVGELSD